MGKLLYSLIVGVIGAGLVHIATLFLIPNVSENDAWSRLVTLAAPETLAIIEPGSPIAASMRVLDPRFITASCRFSLRDGPVLLSGEGHPPFWSISIYNRHGENMFSLNDRIATDGALSIALVTPLQIIELQNEMPPELAKSILAEADIDEGFVVLRTFVPDQSYEAGVRKFITSATCQAF